MKTQETIDRSDVQPILATYGGCVTFVQALKRIASNDDLLRLLNSYIFFNSVFGSGVANLAGEIGSRQDLFRDGDEPIAIAADRSVEVAADIFFAAIDEFGDRGVSGRGTHRSLAQATLKAAGIFLGYDAAELNRIASASCATLSALDQVRNGYGVNQTVAEPKLFRALGFHMGSELLADEEFNILDTFLRSEHETLVAHLQSTKAIISDREYPAYRWIEIHTTVEADHFNAAVASANRALRYYSGAESRACAKSSILEGFGEFAATQAAFMTGLIDQQELRF
jgi:hypothetical protein